MMLSPTSTTAMTDTKCSNCMSSKSLKKCSCGKVAYCCKSCQLEDWSSHKAACPIVVVKEVKNKGKGLVALRKITAGRTIFKENPLIACIRDEDSSLVPVTEFCTFKKTKTEELKYFMELFDPDKLDPMLTGSLDCQDPDYIKFCNIFAANAITIGEISQNSLGMNQIAGVYKQFSRINHSCNPNTVVDWESDALEMEVRAIRNIEKGEELTGNYMGELGGTRKERMSMLEKNWFFLCQCEVCNLTGLESEVNDKTREFILKELDRLDPELVNKKNLSRMMSDYLEVLAACYTIETESMVELPMLLSQCHLVYRAVRDMGLRWKCSSKARKILMERHGDMFIDMLDKEAISLARVLGKTMEIAVRNILAD